MNVYVNAKASDALEGKVHIDVMQALYRLSSPRPCT